MSRSRIATPPILPYNQLLDLVIGFVGTDELINHLLTGTPRHDGREFLGEIECSVHHSGTLDKKSLKVLGDAIKGAKDALERVGGSTKNTFHKVCVARTGEKQVHYHILHCTSSGVHLVNPCDRDNENYKEFEIAESNLDGLNIHYMGSATEEVDTFCEAWALYYIVHASARATTSARNSDMNGKHKVGDLFEFLKRLCGDIVNNRRGILEIFKKYLADPSTAFMKELIKATRNLRTSCTKRPRGEEIGAVKMGTSWAFTMGVLQEWFGQVENKNTVKVKEKIMGWRDELIGVVLGRQTAHCVVTIARQPVYVRTTKQRGQTWHTYVILTSKVSAATRARVESVLSGPGNVNVVTRGKDTLMLENPHLLSGEWGDGRCNLIGMYLACQHDDLSSASELGLLKFAFSFVTESVLEQTVLAYAKKSSNRVMTWMSSKLTWNSYRVWATAMGQPCRFIRTEWDWNPTVAQSKCALVKAGDPAQGEPMMKRCRWGARYHKTTQNTYIRNNYPKTCYRNNMKDVKKARRDAARSRSS